MKKTYIYTHIHIGRDMRKRLSTESKILETFIIDLNFFCCPWVHLLILCIT